MYENIQKAVRQPGVGVEVAARPTISNTHQEAIRCLIDVSARLDEVLSKVRGAHPIANEKNPEEIRSVMSDAGKINLLAYRLSEQVGEILLVIGD